MYKKTGLDPLLLQLELRLAGVPVPQMTDLIVSIASNAKQLREQGPLAEPNRIKSQMGEGPDADKNIRATAFCRRLYPLMVKAFDGDRIDDLAEIADLLYDGIASTQVKKWCGVK